MFSDSKSIKSSSSQQDDDFYKQSALINNILCQFEETKSHYKFFNTYLADPQTLSTMFFYSNRLSAGMMDPLLWHVNVRH